MDVETFVEGFAQLRDVGDVRQDAQLDLAVVGGDELLAGRGDERRADLAPFLGADGDVLQVRLRRGEPAGRRGAERVGSMDAARAAVHVARQRVGVGGAQLGELPPLEHGVDEAARIVGHLLVGGEIVEQAGARLPLAALGALAAGQLQPLEQQFAELARRAEIELVANEAVDLLLEPRDALRERR